MILDYSYWVFNKAISSKNCDKIIKNAKKLILKQGTVVGYNVKYIRDSKVCFLNDPFIYKLLHPFLNIANKNAGWNYQIDYSESIQFTSYAKNQLYDWHTDTIPNQFTNDSDPNYANKIRKLSLVVNLSDSKEYTGGELQFYSGNPQKSFEENIIKSPEMKNKGSLIVFPSYIYHRVTPVTKGQRYSLVLWSLGQKWK